MFRILSNVAVTLVLATACSAQQSLSSLYNIQKLDYPGSSLSFPLGINNLREVVGAWFDADFTPHGYLWKAGKFTSIDYPATPQAHILGTIIPGINDRGDMVGVYFDAQGFQHGFTFARPAWCPDSATDDIPGCKGVSKSFDVPGATQIPVVYFEFGPGLGTAGFGINNAGHIVGEFGTSGQYSSGYLLQNGALTIIDNPHSTHSPGDGTKCMGVSNTGILACNYITQPYATATAITHGFLRLGSEDIPIDFPGAVNDGFGTQVSGVNSLGMGVGVYLDKTAYQGMIWIAGRFFTVNFPGMPYSELHCINDRGDVTGAYATDAEGVNLFGYVAFLK